MTAATATVTADQIRAGGIVLVFAAETHRPCDGTGRYMGSKACFCGGGKVDTRKGKAARKAFDQGYAAQLVSSDDVAVGDMIRSQNSIYRWERVESIDDTTIVTTRASWQRSGFRNVLRRDFDLIAAAWNAALATGGASVEVR